MLETLVVENLGVIERVELNLRAGLVAISGETGAGKTLLVTALGLLLGDRGAPELIGGAAGGAVVTAEFVTDDRESLVVRRELARSGRSRARVNGTPATIGEVADVVSAEVQLFGQHVAVRLANPAVQAEVVDRFGGIDASGLRRLERAVSATERRLAELQAGSADLASRTEFVRHELGLIEAAAIERDDEDRVLLEELETLSTVREQRAWLEGVQDALIRDGGPIEVLGSLLRHAPAQQALISDGVGDAIESLEETARRVRVALEELEEDPARIAWIEERLETLASLKRRFGPTLREVLSRREALATELAVLEGSRGEEASLVQELEETSRALASERAVIATARKQAGLELAARVRSQLADLALERAVFEVELSGPHQLDPIFLFSANPGFAPVPLARAASGGELSRLMLAIASVVGGQAPSLVLDEVDAGIGGRTGARLAALLRALATGRQILVVTHLAQIAAAATQHLMVEKVMDRTSTSTSVREIEGEDRVREVARMLSGHPDSEAAWAHANELIARFVV